MDYQQNTPVNNLETMPEKKHSVGSVVGAIIVIIVLIAGGLYLWGMQLEDQQVASDQLPFILGDEEYVDEGLPPASNSDAVADIEADVGSTNLDQFDAALDSDMKNLDTELNSI